MAAPSPTEIVEHLCAFEGRGAGSDAERRAANQLAATLRAPARSVEVEPTYVHPQWPWVHAIHCALGIAGSLLATSEPGIGFGLVLLAAALIYLDLGGRLYLVRSLFFRRASQNVIVTPRGDFPPDSSQLILCANYDAPRTGAVYNQGPQRLLAAAERIVRFPLGGLRLPFLSLALLLPPLGAQMAGLDSTALAAAQLPQTLILIVAFAMLAEIGLSPTGPGANENASGVAAAITAFERLTADPPDAIRVSLALIGGGETTHEGLRSFLKTHRSDPAAPGTFFVHIDSVGDGSIRYTRGEGPLVSTASDSALLAQADALILADHDRATPILTAFTTGAYLSAARGGRSIGVTTRRDREPLPRTVRGMDDTPAGLSPRSIEAAVEFTTDLVRLLDRDLSRHPATAASP